MRGWMCVLSIGQRYLCVNQHILLLSNGGSLRVLYFLQVYLRHQKRLQVEWMLLGADEGWFWDGVVDDV